MHGFRVLVLESFGLELDEDQLGLITVVAQERQTEYQKVKKEIYRGLVLCFQTEQDQLQTLTGNVLM